MSVGKEIFVGWKKKCPLAKNLFVGWHPFSFCRSGKNKCRLEKNFVGWQLFSLVGEKLSVGQKNCGWLKINRMGKKIRLKFFSFGWQGFFCRLRKTKCPLETKIFVGGKKNVGWQKPFLSVGNLFLFVGWGKRNVGWKKIVR